MSKKTLFIAVILIICFASSLYADIKSFAKSTLSSYGKDSVIVSAVEKQNAKNVSLNQIKKTDEEWMATIGMNDFMNGLLNNECAKKLKSIQNKYGFIIEVFVMDNKGANVAMTDKTSDYWQGDEDKFIKSYNAGKGAIHYGDEEFDESTQSYLVQVSVPVISNGKAIGAITFGIDLGTFDQ